MKTWGDHAWLGNPPLLPSPLFLSALSLFGLSPLLWFLFLWFVLCFLMVFRLCFFFGWIGRVNTRFLLLFCCCFLFFPSLVFRLSSSALWVFFLFCLSVFSLFFSPPPPPRSLGSSAFIGHPEWNLILIFLGSWSCMKMKLALCLVGLGHQQSCHCWTVSDGFP